MPKHGQQHSVCLVKLAKIYQTLPPITMWRPTLDDLLERIEKQPSVEVSESSIHAVRAERDTRAR